MITAYIATIKGRVTGVGFRYYTMRKAQKYPDLKGYVRNVSEVCVEVLVQGEPEHIDLFLDWIKIGPSYSCVRDFKVNQIPINESRGSFRIKY